jgi:hypothetical protein
VVDEQAHDRPRLLGEDSDPDAVDPGGSDCGVQLVAHLGGRAAHGEPAAQEGVFLVEALEQPCVDVIEQIRDGARRGVSTLVVSSEAEDLERLCDRVLVFRDGAVLASLSGSDITKERITERSYARAVSASSA